MRWLVALSLRNPIVIIALGVLLVVVAMTTLRTTPLDVFPEFAPPLVEVQTEAPGLSTNEVESLVTVPLEAALNGVPGLKACHRSFICCLPSFFPASEPPSVPSERVKRGERWDFDRFQTTSDRGSWAPRRCHRRRGI